MLAFMEFVQLLQLLDLGGLVVLAIIMVKWAAKKDRQYQERVDKQEERSDKQNEVLVELVREVTEALTDKNNTDHEMSDAIEQLALIIREKLRKDKDNEKA